MLDTKIFGEKLKNHRKKLGLTQEQVADKVGVSPQAVSKWEAGDCLPDCFNLKALGETYGVSLDILLETESADSAETAAARMEQLGDEFIWANRDRHAFHAHHDLGDDLWQFWKGLYFLECGDREEQIKTKKEASLRICSDYGMKIWDDDGVACIIQSALREKLDKVTDRELNLLQRLASPEGFALISALDTNLLTSKETLAEQCGMEPLRLNELLLMLMENNIIEYVPDHQSRCCPGGYKIGSHFGIAAYMVMAAAFILSKKHQYRVSEYVDLRN